MLGNNYWINGNFHMSDKSKKYLRWIYLIGLVGLLIWLGLNGNIVAIVALTLGLGRGVGWVAKFYFGDE